MPRRYLNIQANGWKALQSRNTGFAIPLSAALKYEMLSRWLSTIGAISDLEHVDAWKGPSPIFIVGHWRSGTTLLHDLLCANGDFAAPSTFACMNPQTFLLAPERKKNRGRRVPRPVDGRLVSNASAQEDEFALLGLGAISPYWHLLIPALVSDIPLLCSPSHWSTDEMKNWREIFFLFANTIQQANLGRTLIFKSPSHSFRIGLLAEMFPDSKFIRVLRDPNSVFASTRELWSQMWNIYAIAPPINVDDLNRAVALTMCSLNAACDKDISNLASRVTTIKYEDLVTAPGLVLERAGEELGLSSIGHLSEEQRVIIEGMASYRGSKLALSRVDHRSYASIYADQYAKYGYS